MLTTKRRKHTIQLFDKNSSCSVLWLQSDWVCNVLFVSSWRPIFNFHCVCVRISIPKSATHKKINGKNPILRCHLTAYLYFKRVSISFSFFRFLLSIVAVIVYLLISLFNSNNYWFLICVINIFHYLIISGAIWIWWIDCEKKQ